MTYVELKEIKLVEGYLMVLVMHCFNFIALTSKEKKTKYLLSIEKLFPNFLAFSI